VHFEAPKAENPGRQRTGVNFLGGQRAPYLLARKYGGANAFLVMKKLWKRLFYCTNLHIS